ncbi:enoyl-ACP reductase FabV [Vagococcus carniphilus]|uniref:Trans-2-enoyl-CoA reductase [NADH] n=1 Tax=Vagococcus carniphilus TaxID=218144 RepID=A0A430B898_9ENTE|nr:enoyl-ACP reductase FabV [Vagococcus carniphilus]QNN74190.1 trans-2-enoyl-CoA reductase family protein [Vagococcus carniphilus]RSU16503.1 trans-2-enoyl-CoA reductase [Vagococcus carniphilus]
MKVEMKLKGNMARSVNPYGCKQEVLNQINYVKAEGDYEGPKKVLVLGASSSYGLASRITAAFGSHADTIGVSFERGPKDESMLGTAGWYNNIFFREFAEQEGLIAKNFIGDAFSLEMKEEVIKYIKESFGGKVDMLVYSLAAPKRTDYKTGITYSSALKPIGQEVSGENINLEKEELFTQVVEPATEEEIEGTVKVMGGEDWEWWIELLKEADCLAEGFKTVLYSYIGPKVTHAFYHDGSLGVAKEQAEESSKRINENIRELNGQSLICVSKAVTTKASVVIPILPKYLICLYKVMKEQGIHETPIMHKDRIFRTMLYGNEANYDEKGRLRPDSWELSDDVQRKVNDLMAQLTPQNFKSDLTEYQLFKKEFFNLNGFEVEGNTINEVDFETLKAMKP